MRAYGLAKNIALTSLILLLSLVPLGTNVVCAIPSYMAAHLCNLASAEQAAYRVGIQGEMVPLIGCLQFVSFPQEVYIG